MITCMYTPLLWPTRAYPLYLHRHTCMCRFDRVGRSRNLHKGPHKREYFGKEIIFNENQHENYDMINNFQQSRRQRCRSFKKAKLGRGGGRRASTRTRVVSVSRSKSHPKQTIHILCNHIKHGDSWWFFNVISQLCTKSHTLLHVHLHLIVIDMLYFQCYCWKCQ